MKLNELYNNAQKPIISFEVFPPKGDSIEYDNKVKNLLEELAILSKFQPSLISVTYGAGGSSREKTYNLVHTIKNTLSIPMMPHFTCVNFNKEETLKYIKQFEKTGISNILALRGDAPIGTEKFIPSDGGFAHANELVEFLKANTNLSIAVAGYPEKHPEAIDFNTDINNLKKKVNAGADVIFTQLFFDNEDFYKYCNMLKKVNINIPVIPGIMVLQSVSQIERIVSLSGSKLPFKLQQLIDTNKNDPVAIKQIGIEHAINQVEKLLNYGVKGLHFYPLNKSFAVSEVLKNIKIA